MPGSAQNMALTYDDASNVTAVTDRSTGEVDGYAYDALDRLTSMTVNGIGAASYSYDAIGNMTGKQEGLSGANPTTLCYPSSGSARPHAVTNVFQGSQVACTTANPWLTLAYDANGNLATQGSSTYTFDAENRLKTRSVTGGTESYVYDASGTLVKRVNSDGTWTVYVGGVYEKSFNADGTVAGYVKYYAALGKAVAMRRTPATGASTLYYTLSDHLGSTSVITDTSGTVVASQKYWPYGAVRSATGGGVTQTDRLFTGQQQEAPASDVLGLYDYRARFYSTVVGRFVSADPTRGSGLGRYTYVGDNPLGGTDPSGYGCSYNGHLSSCTPNDRYDGTPTPTNTVEQLDACKQAPVACLIWAATLEYGSADNGLVIAMGFRDSYSDYMNFSGYIGLFWDRFKPSCAGNAMAGCFATFGTLLSQGKAMEAFKIFGVLMIETYLGGWSSLNGPLGGIAARSGVPFGQHVAGYDALDWAMTKSGVNVVGVIGFSSGAATVAEWYADHKDASAPFYLVEPYGDTTWGYDWVDPAVTMAHPWEQHAYRGFMPAHSCAGGVHCSHNHDALTVMQELMPDLYY